MKKVSNIIADIAKNEGISEEECRRDMEAFIDYAYNNPDLENRKKFKELFNYRKPTAEEFIIKMALQIKTKV